MAEKGPQSTDRSAKKRLARAKIKPTEHGIKSSKGRKVVEAAPSKAEQQKARKQKITGIAIGVFAVIMALSMTLPSLTYIFGNNGQNAAEQESAQQASDAMDYLEAAYAEGRLSDENIETAYRRILAHKARLPEPAAVLDRFSAPDQQEAADRIMTAGIRLLHAPQDRPLPPIGPDTVIFGTKARRNAIVNDDIELDAARAFADAVGGRYAASAPDAAPETALVFIGRHPDAGETVRAAYQLAERGTKLTAVSLHTPTCLRDLPDSVWKIGAWQYDELSIRALARWFGAQGGTL